MEELKNEQAEQAQEQKAPCEHKHGCGHHGHGDMMGHHGKKCGHGHGHGKCAHKKKDVIKMLRKCGHYLHHEAGAMADKPVLTAALTPEEQKILCVLLNKLYNSWVPEEEQAARREAKHAAHAKAQAAAAAKAPEEAPAEKPAE